MESSNDNLSKAIINAETYSQPTETAPKDVDYFDATSMKSTKKPANSGTSKKTETSVNSGNSSNNSKNVSKNYVNTSKKAGSTPKNTVNTAKNNVQKGKGSTHKNSSNYVKNDNLGSVNNSKQQSPNIKQDAADQQDKPDTLVVFYTRTGNSRIITDYIASNTGAHVTELKDKPEMDRKDVSVTGAMKAAFGLRTQLMPVEYRPINYSKIVLVTPIWCFCMTPQIRTYISYFSYDLKEKDVYMVTVSGMSAGKGAAKSSENDYDVKPKAQFSLCLSDIKSGEYVDKLSGLIDQLKA